MSKIRLGVTYGRIYSVASAIYVFFPLSSTLYFIFLANVWSDDMPCGSIVAFLPFVFFLGGGEISFHITSSFFNCFCSVVGLILRQADLQLDSSFVLFILSYWKQFGLEMYFWLRG